MQRRTFLATGLAAGSTVAVAGCLAYDGDDDPDGDADPNGTDGDAATNSTGGGGGDADLAGYAPAVDESVPAPDIDPDALETVAVDGVEVPLLPIEAAHAWHGRRDARFVDARSQASFDQSHVAGAVLSPSPNGLESDDPTADWPAADRVVTYCTCPHALSTQRAASLLDSGHEAVFAIDEGFGPWVDRGYPTEGEQAQALPPARTVAGQVGTAHAGDRVWVRHASTAQRYPGEVRSDGSYELHFRFADVDPDDRLVVETPAGSESGTVAGLTDGTEH